MSIKLESIYSRTNKDAAYSALYQLLAERQPYESISHVGMPTIKEHEDFLNRKPYKGWYLIIQGEGNVVGSIYLSFQNEIGIAIFNRHRRNGYGKEAIKKLIEMYPNERYFLANINPINEKSEKLFQKLGFILIQHTYKYDNTQRPGETNAVS